MSPAAPTQPSRPPGANHVAVLATESDIAGIPKAELHVHLNGSITEATASVLARRHGADPQAALRLTDGRYAGRYPDFRGFLEAYLAANDFVRTPDDLELVAAEFARAQAAQSIVYSEAIFTAMIYVRNGMEPPAIVGCAAAGFWQRPDRRHELRSSSTPSAISGGKRRTQRCVSWRALTRPSSACA